MSHPNARIRLEKALATVALAGMAILVAGCRAPLVIEERDFSPDGTLFARPRGVDVELQDTKSRTTLRALVGGHQARILSVHFSSDGTRLVSGDADGTIVVWDPRSGERLCSLAGHEGAVEHLATRRQSPDLASGSADRSIKLWDLGAGKEVGTLLGHSKTVTFVGFSPDGKLLASASKDKTVKIWDVATRTPLRTLVGHATAVRSVGFDPTGSLLATGGTEGAILLWDLNTGQTLHTLEGAPGPVLSLHFSSDGQWMLAYQIVQEIATNRVRSTLGIWKVRTGEHVVNDYGQEVRLAPPDWPYRAVVREVMLNVGHLTP